MESIDHILLDCPFVHAVWFGSPLSFSPPQTSASSFHKWIQSWVTIDKGSKAGNREVLGLISFIVWHIWLARNALIFNHRSGSPMEVVKSAQDVFNEFLKAKAMRRKPHSILAINNALVLQPLIPIASWTPPPQGCVKINSDLSQKKDLDSGGFGFIIQNHEGVCLLAVSEPSQIRSILCGEGFAMRIGLLYTLSEGFEYIIAESDNLERIQYLNNLAKARPVEASPIIHDITHLRSYFIDCSFHYICRECNSVADSLARRALSLSCKTE
ncbi:uncharacterized protein LOC122640294 [Telopea speciosissima]|uniref:uncharacterized protein LOC122640294 n=1 Tax=Telopea speciosissima TaxID=54955 RepID=UPI001CC5A23D|nr:uncharacterized protein LOC122640294 [Telopea speciosissima]